MEKKKSGHQSLIDKEYKELSIKIALCRYDLIEAVLTGVPLGLCKNINTELSELLFKRLALRLGKYQEYANHVRYTLKY